MKTIYLDTANDEAMDELRAGCLNLSSDRDTVIESITLIADQLLKQNPIGRIFGGPHLSDEDGTSYETVTFQILSSYKIDGETYISGTDFRLNYSHYTRELLELADEAFRWS